MRLIRDEINVGLALSLVSRDQKPMACCPRDGAPLIPTMHFTGAEFYCLECGDLLGFLSPMPLKRTAELESRLAALQAEWDANVAKDLIHESHIPFHSAAEVMRHREAILWLKERAGRD